MTAVERRELERDQTAAFWLQVENTECFDDVAVYAVEVPAKEHKKPEVMEAKDRELENLEKYEVFEEVEDTGQEKIGSRWVITRKEKADGQKCEYKGRLVAKGFQEKSSPQADSPTMRRESLKLFFALAANEGFKLRSVDIRAAFLQAKNLEREIFLQPPKDVQKEGTIWRLKKPLYGLNDASRKFWLKIKEVFKNFGLKKLVGDEALYYKHNENGDLIGLLSTHVDDFSLAGTEEFLSSVTEEIGKSLDISKVEDGSFRFTGIDVEQFHDRIELSMDDYAASLEDVAVREDKSTESLNRDEMRILRKYVGKLSWLASNSRPDISIYTLNLAKKQKQATLKDLRDINRILQKVREKKNTVVFRKIGEKEDLCLIGITDASYHQDQNAISGEIILIGNMKTKAVAPIYWKSGVIRKVCLSPKAAETRSLMRVVDDSLCLARQISMLLNTELKVKLFTDSRPLLESLGSSGQVEEKTLRQSIASLKQNLEDEEIAQFSWIPGSEIIADIFTKQGSEREALEEIMNKNVFRHSLSADNVVIFEDEEIKIRNLITKTQADARMQGSTVADVRA